MPVRLAQYDVEFGRDWDIGRYLDGGYSLRFRSTGGDRQTATAISVSASDKELDVSAPKTIR